MSLEKHIEEHVGLGLPWAGGAVQAESYGANSSASATANTAAIQKALDKGGLVTLTKPGTYNINKTIYPGSDTHFYVGPGVTLFLAASSNCNMIRNSQSAALLNNIQLSRSGTTVTVIDYGHQKAVGDYVLVASGKGTDATYIGEYQVTAVNGNNWTYTTATSGAPTNPTNWLWIHHNYSRLAYTAFSGNGVTVTVTEAGHSRKIGDPVWINGITPTSGVFDGQYEITATTSSTWSYTATGQTPTAGTAKVVGQRNIKITIDGLLDGNTTNQASFSSNDIAVYLHCVGDCEVSGNIDNTGIQAVKTCGVTDFRIPWGNWRGSVVGVQCEGFWNRVSISNITHQGIDDNVAFTQVSTSGSGTDYSHTASPFGIANSDNATVKNIRCNPSLTAIKVSGSAPYTMGNILYDGVYGTVTDIPIRVINDAYLVGGSASSIILRNIDVSQPSNKQFILYNMSGICGYFSIDNFVLPACLYFALFQTETGSPGTISKLFVEKFVQTAASTGTWLGIGGGAVAGFTITDLEIKSGNPIMADAASGIYLGDTTTRVDHLRLSSMHWTQNTGARNSNVIHQNSGKMDKVTINNVSTNGIGRFAYNVSTATAVTPAVGITWEVTNYSSFYTTVMFEFAANLNYTYLLSNVKRDDTGQNLNQSVAGTHRIQAHSYAHYNQSNSLYGIQTGLPYTFYVGNGSTSAAIFSINAKEIPIDLSVYGGAGNNTFTPLNGDIVYNTNAALGTLGVAGPVIRSSTSGAARWHLLADPTKLY